MLHGFVIQCTCTMYHSGTIWSKLNFSNQKKNLIYKCRACVITFHTTLVFTVLFFFLGVLFWNLRIATINGTVINSSQSGSGLLSEVVPKVRSAVH